MRSHHVQGFWDCDILGIKQWEWLEEQLHDHTANLVLIGTGLQVYLNNILLKSVM